MALVLADTNLWLRSVDPDAAQHEVAKRSLKTLAAQGHEICVTSQVLIEFWAVATRPKDVNGLGWSTGAAWSEVRQIWDCFVMLNEPPNTFALWLELVEQHDIKGKHTHDAKLAALLEAQRLEHLLTFNGRHFTCFPRVKIINPEDVVAGAVEI